MLIDDLGARKIHNTNRGPWNLKLSTKAAAALLQLGEPLGVLHNGREAANYQPLYDWMR